jgi:hypothetical protein
MTPSGRQDAVIGRARRLAQAGMTRCSGTIESIVDYLADDIGEPGRTEVLRPIETVRRRPPRHVDGLLHEAFAPFREVVHPAVYRATIPGARVLRDSWLTLSRDRRLFVESARGERAFIERECKVGARLPRARAKRARFISLVSIWAPNHYHWLVEALPRLALVGPETLEHVPVLVPPQLSENALLALRALGVRAEAIVPVEAPHIQVDELVFPSLAGRSGDVNPTSVRWLRERLAPAAGSDRRKLYVSRVDAPSRPVVNEEAVRELMRARGFDVVVMGDLTLAEQLQMYADASCVIAPHGAALAGLVAARDAVVIELFGAHYVNPCYYTLCEALDLEYWYLIGQPQRGDGVLVDIDALRRTMSAVGA